MTINELIMKIEDTAHLHEKEASFYKNMLSVLYGLIAEEACEEACEEDNYDIDSFFTAETNQTALEQIDVEEAAYIEDERIALKALKEITDDVMSRIKINISADTTIIDELIKKIEKLGK